MQKYWSARPWNVKIFSAGETELDTELDNYLDKFEKARLSEDINQQFYWLNQAIDNLFHASNVKDLTRYLSWMLDLARKK